MAKGPRGYTNTASYQAKCRSRLANTPGNDAVLRRGGEKNCKCVLFKNRGYFRCETRTLKQAFAKRKARGNLCTRGKGKSFAARKFKRCSR